MAPDLGVALPTWTVAALVALPLLDVLHSLSPWSYSLWVQEDHGAWTRFWSVVVGLRWGQTALAAGALVAFDVAFAGAGVRLPSTPVLAGSVALAAAATAWYAVVAANAPTMRPTDAPNDLSTTYPADRRERALWFVAGGVTAGICEEFVYRGAVFAALLGAGFSLPAAAVGAAFSFAVAHGFAALNPRALAVYLGYALVATALVVATGSLVPAVAVHLTWNLVSATRDLRAIDPSAVDAAAA